MEGVPDQPWLHMHGLVITTPRLILRDEDPHDEHCVAALYHIRNDPKALELVPYPPLKDLEESRKLIETRQRRPCTFNFIIELRDSVGDSSSNGSGTIIGLCGGVRTPEFGYWIGSEYWRKGYTIEAMRAVLDVYWDMWPSGIPSLPEDKRDLVELAISPENPGSLAVARRLGAVKVGEKLVDDEGPNGTNPDGTKKKFTLEVYGIKRPSPDEMASKQRSYQKLEVVGPNFTDTPPPDAEILGTTKS